MAHWRPAAWPSGLVKPGENPSIPHPGRTFYAGRWRTPEQVKSARDRACDHSRRYSARRTPEQIEAQRARNKEAERRRRLDPAYTAVANERRRARRATDPEYAERVRARDRARSKEKARRRRAKYPEYGREMERRRRARLRAATVEPVPVAFMWLLDRLPCFYCGDPGGTADHFWPLKPGPHAAYNLLPACRSCNARKGARDPRIALEMVASGG